MYFAVTKGKGKIQLIIAMSFVLTPDKIKVPTSAASWAAVPRAVPGSLTFRKTSPEAKLLLPLIQNGEIPMSDAPACTSAS